MSNLKNKRKLVNSASLLIIFLLIFVLPYYTRNFETVDWVFDLAFVVALIAIPVKFVQFLVRVFKPKSA